MANESLLYSNLFTFCWSISTWIGYVWVSI